MLEIEYTCRILFSCLVDLGLIISILISCGHAYFNTNTREIYALSVFSLAQLTVYFIVKICCIYPVTPNKKRWIYLLSLITMYGQSVYMSSYITSYSKMTRYEMEHIFNWLSLFFSIVSIFISWGFILIPEVEEMYAEAVEE